jgi:hypothetical protein
VRDFVSKFIAFSKRHKRMYFIFELLTCALFLVILIFRSDFSMAVFGLCAFHFGIVSCGQAGEMMPEAVESESVFHIAVSAIGFLLFSVAEVQLFLGVVASPMPEEVMETVCGFLSLLISVLVGRIWYGLQKMKSLSAEP